MPDPKPDPKNEQLTLGDLIADEAAPEPTAAQAASKSGPRLRKKADAKPSSQATPQPEGGTAPESAAPSAQTDKPTDPAKEQPAAREQPAAKDPPAAEVATVEEEPAQPAEPAEAVPAETSEESEDGGDPSESPSGAEAEKQAPEPGERPDSGIAQLVNGSGGCWKILSGGERVDLTEEEWRQELSHLIASR